MKKTRRLIGLLLAIIVTTIYIPYILLGGKTIFETLEQNKG